MWMHSDRGRSTVWPPKLQCTLVLEDVSLYDHGFVFLSKRSVGPLLDSRCTHYTGQGGTDGACLDQSRQSPASFAATSLPLTPHLSSLSQNKQTTPPQPLLPRRVLRAAPPRLPRAGGDLLAGAGQLHPGKTRRQDDDADEPFDDWCGVVVLCAVFDFFGGKTAVCSDTPCHPCASLSLSLAFLRSSFASTDRPVLINWNTTPTTATNLLTNGTHS